MSRRKMKNVDNQESDNTLLNNDDKKASFK